MCEPIKVRIGDVSSIRNKRITQSIIYTTHAGKKAKLAEVLGKGLHPTIVFVNTQKNCGPIAENISKLGLRTVVLHGGKTQEEREEAIGIFKDGGAEVLVATDVAGRGLDIPGVAQVVNYDMPVDIERYTHRIGRTGRAGREGSSTSFFTDEDGPILADLRAYLVSTDQRVPSELDKHPALVSGRL